MERLYESRSNGILSSIIIMFLVQKVWLQMALISFMSTKNYIGSWALQKGKSEREENAHILEIIGNITRGLGFGNMCLKSNKIFLHQLLLNSCPAKK